MTYDEALHQIEIIVKELEQAEALPMSVYKDKASEAKKLLDLCESEIIGMRKELSEE